MERGEGLPSRRCSPALLPELLSHDVPLISLNPIKTDLKVGPAAMFQNLQHTVATVRSKTHIHYVGHYAWITSFLLPIVPIPSGLKLEGRERGTPSQLYNGMHSAETTD